MLDELIGRAIWTIEPNVWGVTTSLEIKYRKPVPYNTPLKGVGTIIENRSRLFKGTGQILDQEGYVLAEATATYLKLPLDKIATSNHEDVNIMVPDEVTEI
jgi:acyl-coenzyme A thioesterase PaaI-like protein